MPDVKQPGLTPEQKKKIEEKLINIFRDVYLNNQNIIQAKNESDRISEEIRRFILSYTEEEHNISEVDLLLMAKEKGLELVEGHGLIFFDELISKALQMKAFLIPGMKVEFTEETASERVTEDDLQSLDHELCVSFKVKDNSEFVKLGNLLDIRAALAKALSQKTGTEKEITSEITQSKRFKESLQNIFDSASRLLTKRG